MARQYKEVLVEDEQAAYLIADYAQPELTKPPVVKLRRPGVVVNVIKSEGHI